MSDEDTLKVLVGEMLSEMRTKGLYKSLQNEYPNIPNYVFNEFYKNFHGDFINKNKSYTLYAQRTFDKLNNRKWKLERLKLRPTDFSNRTLDMFIERGFGESNPYGVPRDAERMALQKTRVFGDGNNEPIIVFKVNNKYDLSEGWHRTMNLLLLGKNGDSVLTWDPVLIKAWVGS